jgi:hypothetical protein
LAAASTHGVDLLNGTVPRYRLPHPRMAWIYGKKPRDLLQ